MACLEIHCADCDHVEFTNEKLTYCKGCGSLKVSILWDEQLDSHDTNDWDLATVTDWEE
jgi:Zn finger protein HypA/HybF involved in hydrogenase expression